MGAVTGDEGLVFRNASGVGSIVLATQTRTVLG